MEDPYVILFPRTRRGLLGFRMHYIYYILPGSEISFVGLCFSDADRAITARCRGPVPAGQSSSLRTAVAPDRPVGGVTAAPASNLRVSSLEYPLSSLLSRVASETSLH